MTDAPRWERESQEDLRSPELKPETEPAPQDTVEFDMHRVWVGSSTLSDPPEYAVRADVTGGDEDRADDDAGFDEDSEYDEDREPRFAGARDSLTATRESVGDSLTAGRESFTAAAGKVGRWFASLDRRPELDVDGSEDNDPVAQLRSPSPSGSPELTPSQSPVPSGSSSPSAPLPEPARATTEPEDLEPVAEVTANRFPTAALGYNRQAVDAHVASLESELAQLREAVDPPMSITEEIERLGEQTASILVVAHDKAHETARRAQQQAARAVSDAAQDAERITTEAQRRLRELDEETDAVWRERERLLADVREVSSTLMTLADAASERFPAAEPVGVAAPAGSVATGPMADDGESSPEDD